MSHTNGAWYRPDIDGLRALAVLSVIFYHFGFTHLPGGFTGVDVFFVISGYLIIRIIHNDLLEHKFSLVNFWERRVRRIVPAAFVVMLFVTIGSYYYILLPNDLADYGQSLMAQSVFASNWWFMGQSDYFAAPDNTIPLLHTWSLAVEEQFYLLFPLLVIFVYPYINNRRRFLWFLSGLAGLSFAYATYLVNVNPTEQFTIPFFPHIWGSATNSSAGFYFIATRFWELLIGGIVAVAAIKIKDKAVAEGISIAGFAAVMTGFFILTETDPFPGAAALLPVLGTAAIIVANTDHLTFVSKLLSLPTLVKVGLISYSLYLWHWPLLVFAQYKLEKNQLLTEGGLFFLLALTFILSYLTYAFVETPVRKKRILAERNQLFAAGVGCLLFLFVVGYYIHDKNGFPERASAEGQLVAAAIDDFNPRKEECFTRSEVGYKFNNEPCLLGMQNQEKIDFVLWGDSHASAFMSAFEEFGEMTNQTGIFFAVSSCPPLLSERPITKDEKCVQETKRAVTYIKEHRPKVVFIVSEWRRGYEYFDDEGGGTPLAPLLQNTFPQLPADVEFAVFQRVQTYSDYRFKDMFLDIESGKRLLLTTVGRPMFEKALEPFNNQVIKGVEGFKNVTILDPINTFCQGEVCFMGDDEGLYYSDSSHLSNYGARKTILPLLLQYEQQRSVGTSTDS